MIYMSNLMIGEIGENHQFKNEINKIIGHHKGKLTLSDTSVGRVVVKSMPEEKSIYCCFEVEMKNPTNKVGTKGMLSSK